MIRMRTTTRIRLGVSVIGVVIALFLFAYPTQSLFAQETQVDNAQARLDALTKENHELKIRAQRLGTAAEIERQARERFNMVRGSEQAYSIVERPAQQPTTTTTTNAK